MSTFVEVFCIHFSCFHVFLFICFFLLGVSMQICERLWFMFICFFTTTIIIIITFFIVFCKFPSVTFCCRCRCKFVRPYEQVKLKQCGVVGVFGVKWLNTGKYWTLHTKHSPFHQATLALIIIILNCVLSFVQIYKFINLM